MVTGPKIRYTDIKNETSLLVSNIFSIERFLELLDEANKIDDITCIIFDETYLKISDISQIINGLNLKNMRYCWYSNNATIPYKSNILDYVKLINGDLFYKAKANEDNATWVQVFPLTIKDLDVMDPLYFEKFNELKNKNN